MSVNLCAATQIKEFKVVGPTRRQMVMRAYRTATAVNAKRFLQDLIKDLPFPLISIQIDGGSESMAEVENACQYLQIPLYVWPPKRSQYNGCVERANVTSRAEVYPFYENPLTLRVINRSLRRYQNLYIDYGPHRALDLMTPKEYLRHRRGV